MEDNMSEKEIFELLLSKISNMENVLKTLKDDIADIKMTLENETNKNIMTIAEGHFDLSRKLSEGINLSHNIDNKLEIQSLYITKHENEINKLIKRIARGA